MASIVLGAAGAAVGAWTGGAVLGISAVTIGGAIGSAVGSYADMLIAQSFMPNQRIEGARLEDLKVTASTEGAVIPRVFGRVRVAGNVIWATDFREEVVSEKQGGKGSGGGVTTTTYTYYASFAVALCEGSITGIGRIWADGELMDLEGVTWRWYPGDEAQMPDDFIEALSPGAPAYRGTAYLVFEDLLLEPFGNRLPQINVEVFRPLADSDTLEGQVRAVCMIPSSGEFVYATETVTVDAGEGTTVSENVHASTGLPNMIEALDRLQASAPGIEAVSLVVAWFGTDLRCGTCLVKPGVEVESKNTSRAWRVNGVARGDAHVVSRDEKDRPVYGGTPADFAVVQAIREMKTRGLRVTFYPFILMDVPPENALPDPYSDEAAGTGQAAFPWRGRVTCSPAPGYAGSPDKTSAASAQVAAFFGAAGSDDFTISGDEVSWTGAADEWGYRRMILHYAHLCAAAGGVDTFLIGSELRSLTTVRGASVFPAVLGLRQLAADVRGILGAGTAISYAADWSEYFGYHPEDGSGDVYFHLDPLWSDANIDFVGIDNYMPVSDWRNGFEHADAAEAPRIYDQAYLRGNIEGGEGYDWFYASAADREVQVRTPITDGAHGEDWVFRYKDLRGWWENPHYERLSDPATWLVPEGDKPDLWSARGTVDLTSVLGTYLDGKFTNAVEITALAMGPGLFLPLAAQALVTLDGAFFIVKEQ